MPAAFLIHGFCTDREDFERLAPLLSARYQKVYSPDLPAHGQKKHQKMEAQQILDFVIDAFDELQNEFGAVDVYGYSMGGALASYVASKRRVNRLVLLSPANKYLSPAFAFNRMGHMAKAVKTTIEDCPELFRHCEPVCTRDEIKKDDKKAGNIFLKKLLPNYSPRRIAQFNKIIRRCNASLAALNNPTLILWGRFDQLVPNSSIRHILNYCRHPATKTVVYADVSHIMLYSCAYHRIIDDIFKFLEATEPPALTCRSCT